MPNKIEYTEKHIQVTRIYRELQKAQRYKVIINEGGARSSKSYSTCQFFLFEKLLKANNFKLLVLRKVRHDLKLSTYETFIDILKDYGIYDVNNHNKSDLFYTFPETNSIIRFSGMDDLRQVKSTGWSSIWMEEANEFENKDLTFLKTRLSTGTDIKIYLTYNPEECWIQDLEKNSDTKFIFSNYKDNPFLAKDYTDMLESIKDEDEDYYKIFTLGERAKRGNLVYNHFKFIDIKLWPDKFDNTIYGIDWGFNSPCSLIEINIKDGVYYVRELIYQTHLTTPEFIKQIKELIPNDKIETASIYCDSEDPGNIQECYNAGLYGAMPSDKEVLLGIETVKRNKINVLNTSTNIMNEYKKYKWKKDKNGNLIDEPVKLFDHALDPIRYAIHTFNPANDLRIL